MIYSSLLLIRFFTGSTHCKITAAAKKLAAGAMQINQVNIPVALVIIFPLTPINR